MHVSAERLLLLICNVQVGFSNPDKEDRLLETVQGTPEVSHLLKRHQENPSETE